MTISSTDSVQTYAGDGSTVTFSYGYVFFDLDEVKVELQDASGNVTYPTKDGASTYDYSVSGTFDDATSRYPNGGDVTFNTAPPSGYTIAIYREVDATQSTDYVENDSFPAESHENALDKLTLLVQQVMDDTDRAFKFPKTETADPAVPVPGTNQYLRSNSAGTGLAWVDEGPAAGALRDDLADGSAEVSPWRYRQSATYSDADTLTTDTTTTDDAGEYVWHVGRRVRVYLQSSDAYRYGTITALGTRGASGTVDIAFDTGSLANETLTVWVENARHQITVDSVSDLQSGAFPSYVTRLWLSGYYGVGTAGGGPLYRDASDTTTADNGATVIVDSDGVRWKAGAGFVIAEDVTVSIPTDFSTLQNAMDHYSDFSIRQGVTITLNVESGHQPSTGLLVAWGDYSHFVITSTDAEVSIDTVNFNGVDGTTLTDATEADSRQADTLFLGLHARMPVLDSLWDMGSIGGNAFDVWHGSVAWIRNGAGVKNAGHHGLHVVNSQCEGAGSIWDGATEYGIKSTRASVTSVQGASADNCGYGILSSRGSNTHFLSGSATGATNDAARCHRSRLNLDDADLSGAGNDGVFAQLASMVSAIRVNVSNAGNDGVSANTGATVDATDSTADSCGRMGLRAREAATINGNGATTLNCTGVGAYAFDNSRIAFTGGDATGSNGGGVNDQIQVQNGSIISAHNATGNLSVTANSLTSSGIIFQ